MGTPRTALEALADVEAGHNPYGRPAFRTMEQTRRALTYLQGFGYVRNDPDWGWVPTFRQGALFPELFSPPPVDPFTRRPMVRL